MNKYILQILILGAFAFMGLECLAQPSKEYKCAQKCFKNLPGCHLNKPHTGWDRSPFDECVKDLQDCVDVCYKTTVKKAK